MIWAWFTRRHELVDRHFGHGKPLRSGQPLWRHLERCESCRERYRVHALLETLNDDASSVARARLAPPALSHKQDDRRRLPRVLTFSAAGLAIAASAILVSPKARNTSERFTARGAPATVPQASLKVFRVPANQVPNAALASKTLAGSWLVRGEGLAFSYTNNRQPGYDFLMVFAVDAKGNVGWFWPAWQDGHSNPQAVAIKRGTFELPEAVFHDFPLGRVEVVGVFMKASLNVKDVEASVATRGVQSLAGPNTFLWRHTFEVQSP